jgi:hypothetical protein
LRFDVSDKACRALAGSTMRAADQDLADRLDAIDFGGWVTVSDAVRESGEELSAKSSPVLIIASADFLLAGHQWPLFDLLPSVLVACARQRDEVRVASACNAPTNERAIR